MVGPAGSEAREARIEVWAGLGGHAPRFALALDDRDGDSIPDWLVLDPVEHGASLLGSKQHRTLLHIDPRTDQPALWMSDGGGVASLRNDLDGDGRDEVVLAEWFGWEECGVGTLSICSSRDGSIRTQRYLPVHGDFAYAIAVGRDVDGDGVGDVVIGSPDMETTGGEFSVGVYSGANLARIRHLDELNPRGYVEGFGASVALLRDLDDDGCAEVLVGCAETGDHGDDYYAAMFSGRTSRLLGSTYTGRRMVVVAALDDDLDGDGVDELLLGFPEVDEVHVVSGASARDAGRFHEWKHLRVLRSGDDVRPNREK